MLFSERKLIFIHVPKTAGNFVTRTLVGQSDDALIIGAKQDGVDRMRVEGKLTYQKHQTLSTYAQLLGGDLSGYDVVLFARRPLERLLSMYFSPGRWLQDDGAGNQVVVPEDEISFNKKAFLNIVDMAPSIHDMVGLKRVPRRADKQLKVGQSSVHRSGARVRVFDHSTARATLEQLAQDYDLSLDEMPEREVNVSARASLKDALQSDPFVIQTVEASHHMLDASIFETS